MKKNLFFAFGITMLAANAMAIPFDNSTGGPVNAVVNAGGTGDYLTLAEAATAFSAVAGDINRPWTILIETSTTETAHTFLANTFGVDGSLTIKPAPATTPVVNFTFLTGPAGIFGHFVIGTTDGALPTAANYRASNGKYTIDGSNTVSGTTRDLTFQVGTSGTPAASAVNRLIRIFGDNHGVVVKNMKLYMYDTAGNNSAIALAGGQVPSGGTSVAPDNTVIDNNEIISLGSTTGSFGIDSTMAANGTAAAGTSFDGTQITNNHITTKQRGIFMNGFASTTVTGNTVIQTGVTGTITYGGIFFLNSNTVSPLTMNIDRNTVDISVTPASWTAGQGAIGIFCDSGSPGVVGAVNITNNVVKLNTTGTAGDILYRGINTGSVTSNYVVEHNSVSVTAGAASGATAGRSAGIVSALALTTGSAAINNNIISFADVDGASVPIYYGAATGVTAAGNNIVDFGNVGRMGATTYADLADWQGAGFDSIASGGQSVDPASTTPAWDANLRFASVPAGLGTVAASNTLTDIDGNARPGTGAVPGAQQPPASSVSEWMTLGDI